MFTLVTLVTFLTQLSNNVTDHKYPQVIISVVLTKGDATIILTVYKWIRLTTNIYQCVLALFGLRPFPDILVTTPHLNSVHCSCMCAIYNR
jgi:hypothetical protein